MNLENKKAASLIGFSMKAGKVAGGEFAAEKAIRRGDVFLVILSEDASDNTRKKFRNMAEWRHIPVCEFLGKAELGRLIGKGERSVLTITDEHFAAEIEKQMTNDPGTERSVL